MQNNNQTPVNPQEKLVVIWSSADREVAMNVVFMYTLNSKLRQWWPNVELVVWGPSARLLATDTDLQDYINTMNGAGVKVKACKACADIYGVTPVLEKLGIEVIYMGEPLTHYLKEGYKVLTF